MSSFTLELIVDQSSSYTQGIEVTLPVVSHVHKRIERFIYTDNIVPGGVPVAYLENSELDSWYDLQIANRTYTVPANGPHQSQIRASVDRVVSNSYASPYSSVLITNRTAINEFNRVQPLFYRHELPENCTQCILTIVEGGNKTVVDTGYVVDYDLGLVFTNYQNYYDPQTDSYKLFFITATTEDGTTYHQLLNPEPVCKEADWEDIDLDTGRLKAGRPVYSQERSTSGYTYYFNKSDTWYIRPLGRSLIQPCKPSGRKPKDFWFLRFTNGDVSTVVNGVARRYYLPEFDTQPFTPYKPILYSASQQLMKLNKQVLVATRDSLSIDPDEGLHLAIYIRDYEDKLLRVLTTDESLQGKRHSTHVHPITEVKTHVFYEADKILSWDNQGGFIALAIDILAGWSISCTYYYKATDFEYNLVSLNPMINRDAKKYTHVFYVIPDVHLDDRALHHLVVDQDGVIIYCSQSSGISYPNLQLYNADGSYNSNTVVGMVYVSDSTIDTFVRQYTAGYSNSYAYMLCAECTVANTGVKEDQFEIDVRRPGAVIDQDEFKNAIAQNPRILQSYLGYGEEGQEVPENSVMVMQAPLSLLTDYGGLMSKDQAEELMRKNMPSAGYAVIDWTYPKPVLTGDLSTAGQVTLSWTWEGPNQIYKLYRKNNITNAYSLVEDALGISAVIDGGATPPTPPVLQYIDTTVVSGEVYHYALTVSEGVVEYPYSNSLSVVVRS